MSEPFPFSSRRSPVLGTRGMVATSQPLAAAAGVEILGRGGNAADAAVATAAALAVVEPTSTGIGGDCFALYYDAASRRVHAVNGSGRAGSAASLDALHATLGLRAIEEGGRLPDRHALTVTVPGAVAGWADTLDRHGTSTLADVLAPALRLAERGYPVSPIVARYWALSEELLLGASDAGGELLVGGRAPRAGERFRNPTLASVLREIAEGGAEAFYRGRAAARIVEALALRGGWLDGDDLAAHHSTFEPPISTRYRGHTVFECAPSGQGLTALVALNLLEGFDVASMDEATRLHAIIESLRLAFADARRFIADPSFEAVPVGPLLSEAYASTRRGLIDLDRASVDREAGSPMSHTDTVYLSVVDEAGNACSFINSNYNGFGTGIVPAGCGFSLQNRGAGFVLEPGHPNCIAPRKRPYHTIIPALSTRSDGSLHACFGVMGGFMQPQGHVQVLVQLLDLDADAQAALDAPRVAIQPDPPKGVVLLEAPFGEAICGALEARGHPASLVSGWPRTGMFGRGQVIVRDPENGTLWGGSDPRADGAAIPLS